MTSSKQELSIDLDNYFNNVDLGMCIGKQVGHKQYIERSISDTVNKVLDEIISHKEYGNRLYNNPLGLINVDYVNIKSIEQIKQEWK